MDPGSVTFREEQRFREIWLWLIVIGSSLIAWWGFLLLITTDDPTGAPVVVDWLVANLLALIGLGVPALLFWARLITVVDGQGVSLVFVPLKSRHIPFSAIAAVEPRRYRPIREYGGWGIRFRSRNKIAYNVSGDQGGADPALGPAGDDRDAAPRGACPRDLNQRRAVRSVRGRNPSRGDTAGPHVGVPIRLQCFDLEYRFGGTLCASITPAAGSNRASRPSAPGSRYPARRRPASSPGWASTG